MTYPLRLKWIGTLATKSSVGCGSEPCSPIFATIGSVPGLKRHFLSAAMAAESSNAEPVLCFNLHISHEPGSNLNV